jgi:uncharacterized repeat protein (TIGR01451 family)
MRAIIIYIAFFTGLVCNTAFGQNFKIKWQNSITGTDSAKTYPVIKQLKNKKYIIASSSSQDSSAFKSQNSRGLSDYFVTLLDSNGNKILDRTYGGKNEDILFCMSLTKDGGCILGGHSTSPSSIDKLSDSLGLLDYWIIKLDTNFNIQWEKTFGGGYNDMIGTVEQTFDGGYIVGGYSTSDSTFQKKENSRGWGDYWILKLSSNGAIEWEKTIGGSGDDYLSSIIQTADSGYIMVGQSISDSSMDKSSKSFGSNDNWVVRLDKKGQKLWDKTIGGSSTEQFPHMIQTLDKNFIIGCLSASDSSGSKSSNSLGGYDYWIIKIDSFGNIIWDKTIGGNNSDFLMSLCSTKEGGCALAGYSRSSISNFKSEPSKGGDDFWIVKVDQNGNKEWDNTIGGNGIDGATSIIQTSDNGYVVTGKSLSGFSGDKTLNLINTNDVWIVKLSQISKKITGNVYADLNSNCIHSKSEAIFKNKIIFNSIEKTFSYTNDSIYTHYLFNNDTAILKVVNLATNYKISCNLDSINIIFTPSSSVDTHNINFPIRPVGLPCYDPKITSLSHSIIRPCLWYSSILNYQNEGFDTAFNASIVLDIDTSKIDSFTSAMPYTKVGNVVTFSLGNLAPFSYKSISYSAHIKCNAIIGTSLCIRARIFPQNNCTPAPTYDSSDIRVTRSCSNDTVTIVVHNISATKDMSKWGSIREYEEELVLLIDTFKLLKNSSQVFKYKVAPNKTFTAVIDPKNNHPVTPILIRHDDVCALKAAIKTSNPVLNFSRYDDADEYEEDCDIIRGSYDPNLKSVIPQGLYAEHYTKPNELLKYRIDFQNTGSDTAFKVVVIDTLSTFLNLTTIEPGASSHPYTIDIAGSNIIKFVFDPIKLVDSVHNEPASHGYVTFKIKANSTIPAKAVVKNFADIYFDYNSPVRTNTVFNTMYDTVQIFIPKTNEIQNVECRIQNVYPNPTTDKFIIHYNDLRKDLSMTLTSLDGKVVYNTNQIENELLEIDARQFSNGTYIMTVADKNGVVMSQKLVVEK